MGEKALAALTSEDKFVLPSEIKTIRSQANRPKRSHSSLKPRERSVLSWTCFLLQYCHNPTSFYQRAKTGYPQRTNTKMAGKKSRDREKKNGWFSFLKGDY